jgi:hypothetical protein
MTNGDIFRLSNKQRSAIMEAVKIIASFCDGAKDKDGCGFNKNDTDLGRSLASKIELAESGKIQGLTLNEFRCCAKLAYRYKGQLTGRIGYLVESIKVS